MKKEFLKRVLINLIIALVVIIYFVIFSTQYTKLDSSILYRHIKFNISRNSYNSNGNIIQEIK